jgi:phage gpG-like protein
MAKADLVLTPESQKLINNLAKSGKFDLRPTFLTIGIGYRKEVEAIFNKQQPRQTGLRWPALSEKYKIWKEKHFPGMPLLVRTGALKKSMTQEKFRGNITLIGKISAIFGSSIPYGVYHDSFEPRKSKLPQRNFSEPSERRLGIFRTQIEDYIIKVFQNNNIQVNKGVLQ